MPLEILRSSGGVGTVSGHDKGTGWNQQDLCRRKRQAVFLRETLLARGVIGSERVRVVLVTVDMLNHDREDAKVPGAEAT